MTTAQNKKLAFIPTELNAFTYLKSKINKQDKIINNASKWILILLLWCIGLTTYNAIQFYQQQHKQLNNEILIQELIPIDDFEVIND